MATAAEKAAAKAAEDQAALEKAAADQAAATEQAKSEDQTALEKATADQVTTDEQVAKVTEDQAALEKAAAERVAAAEQASEGIKADALQALESSKEDTGERFEAVCLRDCEFGSVGEVVEISEQEINAGRLSGSIDNHPDAIAYAKTNKE
jgi:hypothetical protein